MPQRDAMTGPGLCPPWLCGFDTNAQKFMYAIGLALDGILEKQQEAQLAKCPRHGEDPSLIPMQAADRVMVQGPAETNAQFITRMQGFYDAWARAGSRTAVLAQLQGYLSGTSTGVDTSFPECLLVGTAGGTSVWDILTFAAAQGDPAAKSRTNGTHKWDWDNHATRGQIWLVLFMHLVDLGVSGSALTVASTGGSGVSGVTSGFATLTGLSGLTADMVQSYVTLSGANKAGNNGTFQITSILSASSMIIANTAAASVDSNNGSIAWSVATYPFISPAPVWGSPDFVWGEGAWGIRHINSLSGDDDSVQIIKSIRQILQTWKNTSSYYPNILVSFGGGDGTAGNEFSPLSTSSTGNPSGDWDLLGKLSSGAWVPTRAPLNQFTSFCDGTGISVSCYEKNRT